MFDALATRSRFDERLLARVGGERMLTDLRHVAELVQHATVTLGLGLAAGTRWLADRIADPGLGGTADPARRLATDTAAVLRAAELRCDAVLKATQVDGVYSDDPRKNPDAERYETLDYLEVLSRDLKVMDAAAVTLMRENAIPIVVFNIHDKGGLARVLAGQGRATVIGKRPDQPAR